MESKLERLIEDTRKWADDKGILVGANADKQFLKVMEELIELKEEMVAYDSYANSGDFGQLDHDLLEEIIERQEMEFGDVLVTLVVLAGQLGFHWDECLEKAYNKISKRKGKVINGIFVKEEDLKD